MTCNSEIVDSFQSYTVVYVVKEGTDVELAQLTAVGDDDLGSRLARVTSITLDSLARRMKERKVRVRAIC